MGHVGLYGGVKLLLIYLLLITATAQKIEGADWQHGDRRAEPEHSALPRFLTFTRSQRTSKASDSDPNRLVASAGHLSQNEPVPRPGFSLLLSALLPQSSDLQPPARRRKRTPIGEGAGSVTPIPPQYSVFVVLQSGVSVSNTSVQARVTQALAATLNLPSSNIILKHTNPSTNTYELYVVRPGHTFVGAEDLVPASDVERAVPASQLSSRLTNLDVQAIYTKMEASKLGYVDSVWAQPFFPYVLAAAALLIVASALALVYCCCVCRHHKGQPSPSRSSPSPPAHVPQQICLYPTAKPDVNNATLIQPDVTQIYTNKSCGQCDTPVHTPPMRLKKGLLERRGSNASLTLDLGPPTDKPSWGSPPRESSAEEYLLSAGNRMSRKQLRNCLKNVKLLYEEFWEIPMNHPDRVEIPGSGMKNRYRTIIPNEHTRVKLPEEDNDILTTYINANYIRGYAAEPHAYIATQGPMSHTVIDFWRMIWNERAPIVVMITKLKKKKVPTATLR